MTTGTLASRQATGPTEHYTADTSRVFRSWEEWQGAYDDLRRALGSLDALTRQPVDSAAWLLTVLQAHERVHRIARAVEGYVYLRLQLDGGDEEARSRQGLLDDTDRTWYGTVLPAFTQAMTAVGPETAGHWLAEHDALQPYGAFLQRFFRSAEHPYPEGQEELRQLADLSAKQSDRVYRAVAVTEAPVVEIPLASGETLSVDPARARSVFEELGSPADRDTVSRVWLETLGERSQTYAALLEGIVQRFELLAAVRGFDSALDAQLHGDAIPSDTVRTVIRVARDSSAPLRRYHRLRQRLLEIDSYGMEDRFVRLATSHREIDLDTARRWIVDSTEVFGPEVQELVRLAFTEGWIDTVERPGKRVHGGSTFVSGHPFVFVNYRGTLDVVFQLTHEIGHAVHALLSYRHQLFIDSHRSSLTSEVVAGVFEGALVDHLVAAAEGSDERVRVLDLSIQNLLRLFYRPILAADFELRLYETETLMTGPALGALYSDVVSEYYGESVILDDWDAHLWQMTPHYYTAPLYMGRYGLSTAAATALVARLTSPVDSQANRARQDFFDLMAAGVSNDPLVLLRRAGVDLEDPETIAAVVDRFESLVEALEQTAFP